MPAASPAARRAPQGRLDPVENICKSPLGEEQAQAAPRIGDGRHRRAYLQAARSEGWGQAGARCGQRTMVCAEGGTVRIAPQLCDTWACKVCGPRRVAWLKRQLGAAVERHGLDQFWTLTIWTKTCTPVESFEVATRAWHKLRTRLQQVHGRFSFVWTIEATKQGYAHLHLLTSLPIIAPRALGPLAPGVGRVVRRRYPADREHEGVQLPRQVLRAAGDPAPRSGLGAARRQAHVQ